MLISAIRHKWRKALSKIIILLKGRNKKSAEVILPKKLVVLVATYSG